MEKDSCPLCGSPARITVWGSEPLAVECHRCGDFQIEMAARQRLYRESPEVHAYYAKGVREAAPGTLMLIRLARPSEEPASLVAELLHPGRP